MNVTVGQEVAVQRKEEFFFGWTVSKVTPSGQITATRGDSKIRFDKRGSEIGGGWYGSWLIVGDGAIAEARKKQRVTNARRAIVGKIRGMGRMVSNHETAEGLAKIIEEIEADVAEVREAWAAFVKAETETGKD